MGYGLDSWFGTWPILFLIMFFLGSAAGMLALGRKGVRELLELQQSAVAAG